jgi:hypothetical protein
MSLKAIVSYTFDLLIIVLAAYGAGSLTFLLGLHMGWWDMRVVLPSGVECFVQDNGDNL